MLWILIETFNSDARKSFRSSYSSISFGRTRITMNMHISSMNVTTQTSNRPHFAFKCARHAHQRPLGRRHLLNAEGATMGSTRRSSHSRRTKSTDCMIPTTATKSHNGNQVQVVQQTLQGGRQSQRLWQLQCWLWEPPSLTLEQVDQHGISNVVLPRKN